MNKTALIISYYFPPLGMGGVQRMTKLAKYLPQFGYDVIVLTVKPIRYPARDRSLLDDLPASVRIYRSGSGDPARIGRFIPLPSRANAKIKTAGTNMAGRLWPDSKIGWKKPAVQTATKILTDHRIDIILSSSPPITGHLVAMEIASRHNLAWIADFRDLWESRLPEQIFTQKDHVDNAYRLLRDISGAADAVTRVNDSIGKGIFPRAKTIMGGYDPDDFEFLSTDPGPTEFSFCYLGTVGPMAPIEPFFRAARIKADGIEAFAQSVRFRFVGINDTRALKQAADTWGWKDRIEFLGYLPHREALQETAKSSVYLLSVPSDFPFITTGKLYDYLPMPGTILASAPAEGEAAKIINRYRAGFCVDPGDANRLGDVMVSLYDDYCVGKVCRDKQMSYPTRIDAAREFAAVFDELIDG